MHKHRQEVKLSSGDTGLVLDVIKKNDGLEFDDYDFPSTAKSNKLQQFSILKAGLNWTVFHLFLTPQHHKGPDPDNDPNT